MPSSPLGTTYRQTDIHTGAVRRSSREDDTGTAHVGKLATVGVVVIGAFVWTSGASEPFAPFATEKTETVHAAIMPPAFFFDDDSNALDRLPSQLQTSSAPRSTTSLVDRNIHTAINDVVAMAVTQQDIPGTDIPIMHTVMSTESQNVQPDTGLEHGPSDTPDQKNEAPFTEFTAPATDSGFHEVTVALGDTLSEILNKNGLKADQMHGLLSNAVVKEHLSNIDIGQVFELTSDDDGKFESLTTRVGNSRRVNIERTDSGFDVTTEELPIEVQRVATSGKIDQSLYLAAEQADLKQSTIMELANIFQWELDFARDIQQGDSFSLVYDRQYREGEYIGDGDILAAEFVRGGKSYKAIRFTTDDGVSDYYTPDGKSKRRTFMRHPVDVVRITSKFDPNRLHPVLHKIRAHRGVDYGSPHGSPIYATADGKVIFSGSKNAYGQTVVLKHGEKFSTLYAHMSRISDKSQVGKRVKQGDVIGYVGKTGRVTGTHLHYEFRVNGKQIDPLNVELPAAAPLDDKYLGRLRVLSDEMSVLLQQAVEGSDKQVASAPEIQALSSEEQR